MPRVLRPGTIGFPIILPKGEIIRNVFLKMKIPYGELSEKRDYRKRQGGKNQNLPAKSECHCQGYGMISPFFQNRKSGFLFLATVWRLEEATIS